MIMDESSTCCDEALCPECDQCMDCSCWCGYADDWDMDEDDELIEDEA